MAEGTKSILMGAVVIAVGALLGSFIGAFIGHAFPEGVIHDLFSKEIAGVGLPPTTLNLQVIQLTFGCLLNFNVPSILGILLAAYLFRSFTK